MADNEERPAGALAVIYVNGTLMAFSPWDIQIKLQQTVGAGDGTGRVAAELMMVQSPIHAKAMWHTLGETIKTYEGKFGPIRDVMPELVAMAGTVTKVEGEKQPRPKRQIKRPNLLRKSES